MIRERSVPNRVGTGTTLSKYHRTILTYMCNQASDYMHLKGLGPRSSLDGSIPTLQQMGGGRGGVGVASLRVNNLTNPPFNAQYFSTN